MGIPIKHVIGTVALIGVVIAVGFSYTIITSYIDADIMKQQLNQIAEYVALNLIEITSLVNYANYSGTPMMKILKLPSDLGGRTYSISLLKLVSETGQGYYVEAQLVSIDHDY
jgi:hypothetical protein